MNEIHTYMHIQKVWGLFEQVPTLTLTSPPRHTLTQVNTEEGLKNVINNKAGIYKRPWVTCTQVVLLIKYRWADCSHDASSSVLCMSPDVRLIVSITCAVCLVLCRSWWQDEGHAGDFLDSSVCPRSQRADPEVWQMSQTRCSGQLWCYQGEYLTLYFFLILPFILIHVMYSMRCVQYCLAFSQSTQLPWCVKPCVPLQYTGKWYEIQKLPTAFQKGECGTATYSPKSPGVIRVLNSELLWVHAT